MKIVRWKTLDKNKTDSIPINIVFRRVGVTTVAVEKKCVTYPEYVFVGLVIRRAKLIHFIILSSVASPALWYFSQVISKTALFGGGGSY
jgi:hypothetical protein